MLVELTRTLFRQTRERTIQTGLRAHRLSRFFMESAIWKVPCSIHNGVRNTARQVAKAWEDSISDRNVHWARLPLALITPDKGYRLAGTGFLTYEFAFLSERAMQESQADNSVIKIHHRCSPEDPGKHNH